MVMNQKQSFKWRAVFDKTKKKKKKVIKFPQSCDLKIENATTE